MKFHSEALKDEWLDPYGHLNEAYYLVPFSNATWVFQDHFKIGVPYFDETGCALYTVETHMINKAEISAGEGFRITTQILDLDAKRLHIFHRMERASDGVLAASGEQMLLHVNSLESRACPIREDVKANLDRIYAAHRNLAAPDDAGRSIGIRSRNG